jgi:glucose-1-phosphate cytidylyltransferase
VNIEDVKVVLLAGGFGTRISEESHLRPKPMVEVGGMPILWHIMKGFSAAGSRDFIVCAGYMQYVIKEWFAHYHLHTSDVTFDFGRSGEYRTHLNRTEPWRVTVADTGLNTMTGGRIRRVREYVDDKPFIVTYGDGVSDIDAAALLSFHQAHGKIATMSVFNVGQNYGVVDVSASGAVKEFREKADGDGALINIGYMVFSPRIFDYLEGDETVLERDPLVRLAQDDQLQAYHHNGFWKCMDTARDKRELESLWKSNSAPWKVWR